VRSHPCDRPGRRSRWPRLLTGAAGGGGLHTLWIVIVGMLPQRGDDLDLWSRYFIYASAVPVFIVVAVGLTLAPLGSRHAPLGIGMVVGAVASPLLWLVSGSALHSG